MLVFALKHFEVQTISRKPVCRETGEGCGTGGLGASEGCDFCSDVIGEVTQASVVHE
jgi:hypothetical protein